MFYQSPKDSATRITTVMADDTYYMNSPSHMASHCISDEDVVDFYHNGSSSNSSRTSSTIQEVRKTPQLQDTRTHTNPMQSPRDFGAQIDFNPSSPYLFDYLMQPQTREPIQAIPIELGIESLYEDLDRRKKNRMNATSCSSQVHVVSTVNSTCSSSLTIHSDDALKIELHNVPSEIGRKST